MVLRMVSKYAHSTRSWALLISNLRAANPCLLVEFLSQCIHSYPKRILSIIDLFGKIALWWGSMILPRVDLSLLVIALAIILYEILHRLIGRKFLIKSRSLFWV